MENALDCSWCLLNIIQQQGKQRNNMTYLNLNIGTVFPFFIVNVILTGWLITKHFVINDLENLKIKRIKHY